jgi:alginate O-acetyltransferase complex protein AlgI
MTIVSLPFLLIALGTAALLRGARLRASRAEILLVASLVFALLLAASPRDALFLIAMAASGWVLVKAVAINKGGRRLGLAILCIVGEFVMIRQLTPSVPWLAGVEFGRTVGLSYIMFRIVHLLVDAHGDELPSSLGLRDYLCYLFFFPTFLAGPIQRVQEFVADLSEPAVSATGSPRRQDLRLIITGYFKFTVLAALFFAAFAWSTRTAATDASQRAAAFISFAAYLYVSFSGYTDVARGFGGLMGFRLPENFDRPLLSANFLDVWSRWHISLSDWFKLYVFNPAAKAMIGAAERPGLIPYIGAAGYFLTFFLMGLWHSTTLRFALYGLCLGAGVSVNRLWQAAMAARLGRRGYATLSRQPSYVAISRGLALGYFVLALGFFWVSEATLASCTLGSWAAVALLVLAGMLAVGIAASGIEMLQRRIAPFSPGFTDLCSAAELAGVVIYLSIAGDAVPPVLYQFF